MRVFLDMDGVLADFDRHYLETFGVVANKHLDNVDWALVRKTPGFYATIPPMPDLQVLLDFFEPYHPTILTGVPHSVPEAVSNKMAWVWRHIGGDIPVITCRSKEKCLFAHPGDLLVDDWEKYRDRWESVGGRWITRTSATETIRQFTEMMRDRTLPPTLFRESKNPPR